MFEKLLGHWNEFSSIKIKDGTWKEIKKVYEKVDGTWKLLYRKSDIPETMLALSTAVIAEGAICNGDNGTINLIGKYIKAHSGFGSEGGSNTHTHSYSGSSGTNASTKRRENSEEPSASFGYVHSHTINHTHDITSNEPEYVQLIPYVGIKRILDSLILFYDGASAPEGWAVASALYDKMIKLGESYGSGGANTHGHSYTGNTGSTKPNYSSKDGDRNDKIQTTSTHAHTMNHTHSAVDHQPPYYTMLPIQPDGAGEIPSGACAFFIDSSIPEGWSFFDSALGRFIKTASSAGGTGGATSHSHSYSGYSGIGPDATGSAGSDGSSIYGYENHTHTISHTHSGGNNYPEYRELLFCKKD